MDYSVREILANFKVFENEYYNKLELIGLLNLPDNRDIFIDEGYTWLESRNSMSKVNKFISYIILQSRHRTIDIYIAIQLFSSVDLRFRENANELIRCECLKSRKNKILGFSYKFYKFYNNRYYNYNHLFVPYDKAKLFFLLYDTYEIIEPQNYESMVLEILKQDTIELKKHLEKWIPILHSELIADNVKINITNTKAYMSIYRIPLSFTPFIYSKLVDYC